MVFFSSLKGRVKAVLLNRGWYLKRRAGVPFGVDLLTDLTRLDLIPVTSVMDVGAHRGESALAFARSFPFATVYSFEPVRDNFSALQEARGSSDRIKCFEMALGSEVGTAVMYLKAGSQRHSLRRPRSPTSVVARQEVEVETVDRMMERLEIPVVDLLKIDVEGAELDVLQGARASLSAKTVRALLLEATLDVNGRTHVPLPQLQDFLRDFDYQLVALYDQVVWGGPFRMAYANALFVAGAEEVG